MLRKLTQYQKQRAKNSQY